MLGRVVIVHVQQDILRITIVAPAEPGDDTARQIVDSEVQMIRKHVHDLCLWAARALDGVCSPVGLAVDVVRRAVGELGRKRSGEAFLAQIADTILIDVVVRTIEAVVRLHHTGEEDTRRIRKRVSFLTAKLTHWSHESLDLRCDRVLIAASSRNHKQRPRDRGNDKR